MSAEIQEKPKASFRYVHSLGLPGLIEELNCSLLITTYQAGKLAIFRANQGRLSLLPRSFEQAMGVAVSPERIAVGTMYQVWTLEKDDQLAKVINPAANHDACFLPRRSHVTGNIHVHDMAWGSKHLSEPNDVVSGVASDQDSNDELWLVNTLFSCLCTLDSKHSFVPRWKPSFITQLAAQDRCHLNGLAMHNHRPKYVTALSETDAPESWRANKATSGCVIDVESGETVARGLCMPHSPRMRGDQLYALDAGTGRLIAIDPIDGRVETVAELPGYGRGLALFDQYAFVGLSKIRETTTFGGVPIATHRESLKCGVWVVDLTTGSVVSFLEFQESVDEIFDVQILPGIRNPAVIGLQKDTVHGAFVLPPQETAARSASE